MNKLNYISIVIISTMLLSIAGCASTANRESTGEYFDDTLITTKVKTAIFNESSLTSSEINVETFKGVVQLSGFVSSDTDKMKAGKIASGVNGVKSVNNDIRRK